MNWRAPMNNPVWMIRAKELALVLGKFEHSSLNVLRLARDELGWSFDQTRQVLAAGERTLLFEKAGYWHAQPGAVRVTDKRAPERQVGRPRQPKSDGLGDDRIRFESIVCSCGEKTFLRKAGGYTCIGCQQHYQNWSTLVHLQPAATEAS